METYKQREALLEELVQYLSDITTDTLKHTTVQELVEGFWMEKEQDDDSESAPYRQFRF